MSIILEDDLQEFVRAHAEHEGFASPGDYVTHLIRERRDLEVARDELRARLREGLESPASELTNDEVHARMRDLARGIPAT